MVKGKFVINEKYIAYLAWFIIFFIVFITLRRHPINSTEIIGDEGGYRREVVYLSQYGVYHALSQGTSFFYSALIYLLSRLISVDFLVGARVLTLLFFIISGWLLVKCFEQFAGVGVAEKYLGLTVYGAICSKWLMIGLPDLVSAAFFLTSVYLLSRSISYKHILISAVLLLIGFGIKPTILFAFLAIVPFIFLQGRKTEKTTVVIGKEVLFMATFFVCFMVYHTPGIQKYHQIMIEEKNHDYNGVDRVESGTSWTERNLYFELYNVNHRVNQWYVTWQEIDSFKAAHPEINLKMSYVELVQKHTYIWARNICYKLFLSVPYDIQEGFFFFSWTLVNKVIHNFNVIGAITSLLIFSIFFFERRFIKDNAIIFTIPFFFLVGICLFVITPLQGNWLLFCFPFLALPVVKFLVRYVNIVLLLALQFIFVLLF